MRLLINKPAPLKGLHIRMPIIIPVNGRGFVNQGSGLFEQCGVPRIYALRCSFAG